MADSILSNPPAGSISDMIAKIEKENEIFANKQALDSLKLPSKIFGREEQMEKLVRILLGYRFGHAVPFTSIYGRSGSGKTTLVRHVCAELVEAEHIFVNLRKSGTVFGATNLILQELGLEISKGSNGMSIQPFEQIRLAVSSRLERNCKKLFILALDEFDTVFHDPRGRPSDFVYKLIELGNELSRKGLYFTVVGISNDVLSEYDLEDRVKSRIGTSEIFFAPYHYDDVLTILQERAKEAFASKIDDTVLNQCAKLASSDHGDARRAIDLLRVAAEKASSDQQDLNIHHVNWAAKELNKDRLENILNESSYHFKRVLASIARITFLSKEEWFSTSILVQQYKKIWLDKMELLSYRRVSEILREIEGMGLATSQASSRGRHGFGKQYKLEMSAKIVGLAINPNWWHGLVQSEKRHKELMQSDAKSGDVTKEQQDERMKNESIEAKKAHWNRYVWNPDVD